MNWNEKIKIFSIKECFRVIFGRLAGICVEFYISMFHDFLNNWNNCFLISFEKNKLQGHCSDFL